MRTDGRKESDLRPVKLVPEILQYAEGSAEIKIGNTHLLCTATVEPTVPRWLKGSGQGWISAEYGMLPRSTHSRIRREKALSGGRSQEISRLIGRSLRAAVDLKTLGEKQIIVDCDVIQADGGTRTAAVTGGFVALALAIRFLQGQGEVKENPLKQFVSAISVGVNSAGQPLLDLNYDEDSSIDTDMNIVMTEDLNLVEIQGTAEGKTFSTSELMTMIELAQMGCQQLFKLQREILGND